MSENKNDTKNKKWKTRQLIIFSICTSFLGFYCGLLIHVVFENWGFATKAPHVILHIIIILSVLVTFLFFAHRYKSKAVNTLIAIFIIILFLSVLLPSWYRMQQGARVVVCGGAAKTTWQCNHNIL